MKAKQKAPARLEMKLKGLFYYVAGVLVIGSSIWLVVTGKVPTYTPRNAPAKTAPAARHPLTVVDVYDGDTITLANSKRIRYLGINTTEIGELFSEEARKLNRDLVLGKVVRLELDQQKTDSYGRMLAFVWVNRTNVNLELIRRGLAHLMFIPPNQKHYEDFLSAQREAQRAGLGIWASPEFQTPVRITSFHPGRGYLRIVNISSETLHLAGWSAENNRLQKYVFPDVSLSPGYSAVLHFGSGADDPDSRLLKLFWGLDQEIWDWPMPSVTLRDASGKQVAFKSAER